MSFFYYRHTKKKSRKVQTDKTQIKSNINDNISVSLKIL